VDTSGGLTRWQSSDDGLREKRPSVVLLLLGSVIAFALVLDMIKVRLLGAKRDGAEFQGQG
jgi:hypothetical protein